MKVSTKKLKKFLILIFVLFGFVAFLSLGNLELVLAKEWRQAIGPWKWVFPRDHGSHPDFRTEWWYFTGNLKDSSQRGLGYQLTFFRQGVLFESKDPKNTWSIRDLFLGHFTLTDVPSNQFWYAERLSRKGPGLSGAGEEGMDVWLLNWSAKMEGQGITLKASHQGMELSLLLIPRKPIVLHGQNGWSQKGPKEGQASYYFSYTKLETQGTMKLPDSPSRIPVKGTSWFDHEFGSNQLTSDQVGWDWFSLRLSDGQDLMIYFLRLKDGSIEPASSGTLISPSGTATPLKLSDIRVEILDHWKSPKSGGRYPSRWRIKIPLARIEMEITPLVASQELITEGSTGVVYWEGAVAGKGSSPAGNITCEGYVELTGYAGSLGGLF